MSDDIYTLYNIDKSKLKRDYIKNPLKIFTSRLNKHNKQMLHYVNERPYKEDLEYLYIELNLPKKELYKLFNCKKTTFSNWLSFYNIKKIPKLVSINAFKTQKENNSFNTSKPEEEIYKLLAEKYGEVKRQYKSELYPFACDFYIPSIDTYIEYQGTWLHGFEPYNINLLKHQEKIKLWESKNTKYYNNAIKIWTIRDPLKRQTAKDNNLNWIEFFNMNQFMEWFNY